MWGGCGEGVVKKVFFLLVMRSFIITFVGGNFKFMRL